MYLSLIFLVLIAACALAFIEKWVQKEKYILYFMIGLCLVCLAAFRPEGMDNDFDVYFSYITDYNNPQYQLIVEPSFLWISEVFMNTFSNFRSVLFLYALLGVTFKMYAIRKLSPLLFLPLTIYIGNFFILHEFTQIRVGVAVGLIMIATSYLVNGQKKVATALIVSSALFHVSSLTIIPLLFLSTSKITFKRRILWAAIIPIGYALYFMKIRLTSMPIPFIGEKIELYENLRDAGFIDEVNVFNILILIKIVIFYYCMYFYDIIIKHVPCFSICLKLMGISIFCFLTLTDLPVLAFRISELYGFAEIILFSSIVYTLKPRWAGALITTTLGIALLCLHSFIDDILIIM